MDEAKRLSELDVSNNTAEFMRVFTEKYIKSTVTSRITDHITHIITQSDAQPKEDPPENKTDAKDTDQKEEVDVDGGIEAKPDETRDEKVSSITDEKEKESVQEEKEEEEEEEEQKIAPTPGTPSDYKASLSTGVYGSYSLKQIAIVQPLGFPLLQVSVDSFEKCLMDGNTNQYNAFNILYSKLSLSKDDPSRFGTKLSRYSRIRTYHEALAKTLDAKSVRFPPKNFAFWRRNDDDFLEERQAELDGYFKSSALQSEIASNDLFDVFLGIKPDETCSDRVNIFANALRGTCNELQYIPPSYGALKLTRFDAEEEILLLSLMVDKEQRFKEEVEGIIAQQAEKSQAAMRVKVDKVISNAICKVVSTQWAQMQQSSKSVNDELNEILADKIATFDEAVNELKGKIEPIIAKKLSGCQDDKKGDDVVVDMEQKERDLTQIKPLQRLIERVASLASDAEEKEPQQAFMEYKASLSTGVYGFYALKQDPVRRLYEECCARLPALMNADEKEVMTRYLMESVDACYGNEAKAILNALDGFNKEVKLVCAAMAQLIQMCCEMTVRYLLLVAQSDSEDGSMNILKSMGADIAKAVKESDLRISNDLQSVNTNASRLVLEGVSILCGLIGDLMANVVNDSGEKKVDLKQNLTKNLNESIVRFCECVLDRLDGCVVSVLVSEIKKETKALVDEIYGAEGKVEFEFIADEAAAPETMAVAILENVVDVMTVDLLKKTVKPKRKALDAKFYQIVM